MHARGAAYANMFGNTGLRRLEDACEHVSATIFRGGREISRTVRFADSEMHAQTRVTRKQFWICERICQCPEKRRIEGPYLILSLHLTMLSYSSAGPLIA